MTLKGILSPTHATFFVWLMVIFYHFCAMPAKATENVAGAAAILEQLKSGGTENPGTPLNKPRELLRDLNAFRTASRTMQPEERAKEWLNLSTRLAEWDQTDLIQTYAAIDPETNKPISYESLLTVLPPPSEWPLLIELGAAYDLSNQSKEFTAGMQLLLAALSSDSNKLADAIANYEQVADSSSNERTKLLMNNYLPHLRRVVSLRSNDLDSLLRIVELESQTVEQYSQSVEVPDVIQILGEEKGREWLTKIITSAKRSISVPVGEQTREVAKQIVINTIDNAAVAHWGLVADFESAPIYQALNKRFPPTGDVSESYGERRSAQIYYLLSLIGAGKVDEATQEVKALARARDFSISSEMLNDLQQAGYGAQVRDFMQSLLNDDPTLKIWDPYFTLSARLGKSQNAVDFVETLLGDENNSLEDLSDLEVRYAEALLAINETERAIEILQAKLQKANPNSRSDLGLKLSRLGILLDRKDLQTAGYETVMSVLQDSRTGEESYWRKDALENYLKLSRDIKSFAAAESFLAQEMTFYKDYLQKYAEAAGAPMDAYYPHYLRPLALELVGVYAGSEMWADVITMFDEFPYWGSDDASGLLGTKDSTKTPVAIYLAEALIQDNRAEEAKAILEALLRLEPGEDRAYELYSKVFREDAAEQFDLLFERDQFEERPQIWKAAVLLADGDLDAARQAIELAISIDPSDGEQGPGDRMRAYQIYADILEASGETDKSKLMRSAVEAIRMSEAADKFYDAGIYDEAIRRYRASADKFDGAYCIQSRLAIQLTERGNFDEAAPHYERAYRLMPASFGRVESHCFRCENAFSDYRAQRIADNVFRELLVEEENNPRVQYMMGYLRLEEKKFEEALGYFRSAVNADPHYLNAWKQIIEVGKSTYIEGWEADVATLKAKALDPFQRHTTIDLSNVTDLAGLWNVAEPAFQDYGFKSSNVYQLSASAETVQRVKDSTTGSGGMADYIEAQTRGDDTISHPGVEIGKTRLIQAAVNSMFFSQSFSF